ncbi:Alpha/Beta hydrolase protein [Aspergillus unguis]
MPFQYDAEYAKTIEPLLPVLSKRSPLVLENIPASREAREAGISHFFSQVPESPDVSQTEYHATAPDGHQIPIIAFCKKSTDSVPGPAIVHYHGGGMILGSAERQARPLAMQVQKTGIPIFSVNYRLAPEHKGPVIIEDCYSALVWVQQNAASHGIDPARIAVFGESAGGGLAAGVTLLARDREMSPPIAKQILVYPMLDDRTRAPKEGLEEMAFWKTDDNATAWNAFLGGGAPGDHYSDSEYLVPARAQSLRGLPRAYIDVGELDIFRDECVSYAQRLWEANVSTELHVYPGIPHAFEMVAPFISATVEAYRKRMDAMLSI